MTTLSIKTSFEKSGLPSSVPDACINSILKATSFAGPPRLVSMAHKQTSSDQELCECENQADSRSQLQSLKAGDPDRHEVEGCKLTDDTISMSCYVHPSSSQLSASISKGRHKYQTAPTASNIMVKG